MFARNPPDNSRDVAAALLCAEAFHAHAQPFIKRLGEEGIKRPVEITEELGQLVACATNLALALEMYLKTLLTLLAIAVPQTHDLRVLYDALPLTAVMDVLDRYAKGGSIIFPLRASVTIAKGAPCEPPWKDYHEESTDLPEVLARSRDLFISWRYIFEFTRPRHADHQLHEFEYALLNLACFSLKHSILDHLGKDGGLQSVGRTDRSA